MSQRRVLIFGAGAWGTALALALHRAGNEVILLPKFEAERRNLSDRKENVDWLPGVALPADLIIGPTLGTLRGHPDLFEEAQALFWTIPVPYSLAEAKNLQDVLPPSVPLTTCSKGLLLPEDPKDEVFLSNAFRKLFRIRLLAYLGQISRGKLPRTFSLLRLLLRPTSGQPNTLPGSWPHQSLRRLLVQT